MWVLCCIFYVGSNSEEIIKLPSTIDVCENLKQLIVKVYPGLNIDGVGKWCTAEGSVVSGIREECDHGF